MCIHHVYIQARICWRDYVSHLAWEYLGNPPGGCAWKTSKNPASRRHSNQMPTPPPLAKHERASPPSCPEMPAPRLPFSRGPLFWDPSMKDIGWIKSFASPLGFLFIAEVQNKIPHFSWFCSTQPIHPGPRSKRLIEALRSVRRLVPKFRKQM